MCSCNVQQSTTLPTFVHQEAVPPPRFRLFEVAILHFESEEGYVTNDEVQILGLIWSPNFSKVPGWWYHVRFLRKPAGENRLVAGYQESCREDELLPQ